MDLQSQFEYLEKVRDDKKSKCEACKEGWCTLEETYVTVEQAKKYGALKVKEYIEWFNDMARKHYLKDNNLAEGEKK